MRTVQGTIEIKNYSAAIEQAITMTSRDPNYVILLRGKALEGGIDSALIYFSPSGSSSYGKGDVSPGFRIRIFLQNDDYPKVIDMLRHEKPIHFSYQYRSFSDDDDQDLLRFAPDPELLYYRLASRGDNFLGEPVGEGE